MEVAHHVDQVKYYFLQERQYGIAIITGLLNHKEDISLCIILAVWSPAAADLLNCITAMSIDLGA
jgi:hypothetical protein